ncbi:MAG: HTH-type transcriptional regulator/antitoxin HipB [Rhodothermales bacterium]|jgi:HTH-type transcriptional regulator/antitoxin HipB
MGYIAIIYLVGYNIIREAVMQKMFRSAKQLGSLIHNERVRRGMSQQALADLTGTGQKTISHIENGKEGTRLETIFSLLATLDLEMKLTARGKSSKKSIGDIF